MKYNIMNTVPGNWIPFIPVHVNGSNREIQLRRAALRRILQGDSQLPNKIRPRTTLFSFGLNSKPKAGYKLYEEEIPRAGVEVFPKLPTH